LNPPGTLVQGADHAGYTFSASADGLQVELDFDCDLKGENAICSGLDENSKLATATLSSLEPFAIDVVSTAAPSATGKPSSASPRLSVSLSGALVGVVVLAAHSLV
jgi:hypothetical protein